MSSFLSKLLSKKVVLWAGGILMLATMVLFFAASQFKPFLKRKTVELLEKRFNSRVELADIDVFVVMPMVKVSGDNLILRYRDRPGLPPLIEIKHFSANMMLWNILQGNPHVGTVNLEGMRIHVPPKGERSLGTNHTEEGDTSKDQKPVRLLIEKIVCDDTELFLLPKEAGKKPLNFSIHRLTMRSVGPGRPMEFKATLVNPKPIGDIATTGEFGPWQGDDPSSTPVAGKYTFSNADLSTTKGIAGILSSTGSYKGVLHRIEVDGETDTPDFRVQVSGNPVPLKTQFHAIVDGTNGNTWLQPVRAQFLQSSLVAKGGVINTSEDKGRTVSLDVDMSKARLEDVLRLGVKSKKPILTGAMSMKTKFLLPEGDLDIIDKLKLDGQFAISSAKFTDFNIQEKITGLSKRASGKPKEKGGSVASAFNGRFVLNRAVIRFAHLEFEVPGSDIRLAGSYGLHQEELDFQGHLRMKATVSQTMTGFKSLLLKPIDPFFKKDGAGAVIPIKITGTRKDPSFGLNLRGNKKKQDSKKKQ